MEVKNSTYKCLKCGEPIGFSDKVCPHCGATTKYGETLIENENEIKREQKDARGYCLAYLIWSWILAIILPPIGIIVSIRGIVMATLARYRGFWAFILAFLFSIAWTAGLTIFIVFKATGRI